MSVRDSFVSQTAIFNSNFYPKDTIIDMEVPAPSISFPLVQSRLGKVSFWHGDGANFNDTFYTETTDDIIDEDRNGGVKYDFAHSLGVLGISQVKNLATNVVIQAFTSIPGNIQVPQTFLSPGQFTDAGNGPVGPIEARHNTVNLSGNNVTGCLGSNYPYKIAIPKVPNINQKWEDLLITWNLLLLSVFDQENLSIGNTNFQTFKVFQKAVSVTKKIGGGSSLIPINTIYANNGNETIALSQSLKLDKSQNRGDGLISSWTIQKKVGNSFTTATVGVDYNLILGNLNSDQLEIIFLITGDYKIINYSKGNSSIASGVNESFSTLNILSRPNNITVTVDEFIRFPKINPILTPSASFRNVTLETSPILKGYERYNIIVTPILDLTNASYKKVRIETNNDTNTTTSTEEILTLTNNQWLDLILQKTNVLCFLRKKNAGLNFEETKDCNSSNSFQHYFSQNNGEWEAGYYMTSK